MSKENQLVFVAGPDRSGTTLLTLVLSSHPDVCIMPENSVVTGMFRLFGDRKSLKGRDLESFRLRVEKDPKVHSLKIDVSQYLQTVRQYTEVSLRQAAFDLYEFYRQQVSPNASVIGQKKDFLEVWPVLKTVFPEAKLITIFRDCRATAISAEKNLPRKTIVNAAQQWVRRANAADAFVREYPGDYLELRYEEFVENPVGDCERICQFLSLPFSEEMLLHESGNVGLSRVLRGHESKHSRTAQPINGARANAWKGALDERQVEIIEYIAGGSLVRRNYELLSGVDSDLRKKMRAATSIAWQEMGRYCRFVKNKL